MMMLFLRCCTALSRSVMSNSLQPHGQWPTRLLCPRGFSRQEYWSGLACPSPGNLPNADLPHCRRILYHLSHNSHPPPPSSLCWTSSSQYSPFRSLYLMVQPPLPNPHAFPSPIPLIMLDIFFSVVHTVFWYTVCSTNLLHMLFLSGSLPLEHMLPHNMILKTILCFINWCRQVPRTAPDT